MIKSELKKFVRQHILHLIILGLLLAAMTAFCVYFARINNVETTVTQDSANPSLILTVEKSKTWQERGPLSHGAEYDFVIHNLTGVTVDRWDVVLELDSQSVIDSSWAGLFVQNGSKIFVTGVDYNIDIPPHSEASFGFVLHTADDMDISNYTLTYTTQSVLTDNPLFYILLISIFIVITVLVTAFVNHLRYVRLQHRTDEVQKVLEQSFETFSRIIDAKDTYTEGHSRRVAIYSREIAKRIGFDEGEQEQIYYIAMLHDIGKIGVPDVILNKPSRLDDGEFEVIKSHAEVGGDILKQFTSLPGAADGARHHHERYDGQGYPDRLKGADIPLAARIICVADSFDAMYSDRI
ncbi:MAG: HD domain-containing protein, partial [Lachnospiraceae bacterium]|nr:HD domain-containing protein [Lachnospiraceae bacterium]